MHSEVGIPSLEQESDELTRFGTRSMLMHDLAEAVDPQSQPHTLAIFDLRGYVEAYGRIEGGALLRRIADHFAEALDGARFYRPREDELAVLVDGPAETVEQRLTGAVTSLTERLRPLNIVVAFGAATLPHEADKPNVAMRIADSRDYLRARRPRERRQFPRGQ